MEHYNNKNGIPVRQSTKEEKQTWLYEHASRVFFDSGYYFLSEKEDKQISTINTSLWLHRKKIHDLSRYYFEASKPHIVWDDDTIPRPTNASEAIRKREKVSSNYAKLSEIKMRLEKAKKEENHVREYMLSVHDIGRHWASAGRNHVSNLLGMTYEEALEIFNRKEPMYCYVYYNDTLLDDGVENPYYSWKQCRRILKFKTHDLYDVCWGSFVTKEKFNYYKEANCHIIFSLKHPSGTDVPLSIPLYKATHYEIIN